MLKHIPRKKETNTTYIYRTIKQSIIEFYFIPGDKLSEPSIASELNFSRTPVREALILLEQENLVNVLPQKGTYVSKINKLEANTFIFMRNTIEKRINSLACTIRSEMDIDGLKTELQAQKVMQKILDGRTSLYLLDNSFHKYIYTMVGQVEIWKELQKIANAYNRIRILDCLNQEFDNKIVKKNEKILNFIEKQDDSGLSQFVDEYLSPLEQQLTSVINLYPDYFI